MGQQASKLNKEDMTSLKQETKFTTRELQQWYKGFARDVPSGRLTKEDFISIHRQFYPFGDPTEFATYSFEAFDVDNRGYIGFKDFILSLSVASRGSMTEKLKWSFRMYDRDGDGKIGYNDLLRVVRAIYAMTGTESVRYKEEVVTPEARVGKIWVGFHKKLQDKDSETISVDEFADYKNLGQDVLGALNIYNGLV